MPDKTSAIYAEAFRLEGEVKRLQEALAAARRECEGLRVDRDHLRAATANANKQAADLNALRLKQDEELVALRDEVRHLRNAMARVRDRSNHGDFYEAMKIADAALANPSGSHPPEYRRRYTNACGLCGAGDDSAALAAPGDGEELMRALRDSATVSTRPPTSKP